MMASAAAEPEPMVQTDSDGESEYADASEHGGLEWVGDELAALTERSESIAAELALMQHPEIASSSSRQAELTAMAEEIDGLILALYEEHLA